MATRYGKRIVTDGLVLCLDAADNISAPHNDLPVKRGCIGWYDGDDDSVFTYSSGTAVSEWRDKSGNSNHATMSNGPTRSVTQNSKSGLAFNGSSQWGNAVTGGAISETTMIAVCSLATLTPSGSNSGGGVVSVNQHSGDNFNAIVYNEYTAKRWMNGSSGWARTPNTVSTSDETSTGPHIISNAVKTGAFNLYRNGTNLTSTSYTYSAQTNGKIVIGNRHTTSSNGPVSNGYWYGNIYEVIVYDRVLSSDELTKVHNYLQNKWNIEVSDTKWYDRTTNENNGTPTNSPTYSETNKGYFDFDGTNDYISIPQFDFTSTHSLEWWFNTDNLTEKYTGGYAGHMLCWGHSPSERIQLRTNGGIRIYIHDSSTGTTFDTSNFSVTAGDWIHITATLDWVNKSVKFYQNGVLKDTISFSSLGSWNYTGASNPYDYIDFGRNVSNNNIFFDGKLASIKIYNKVLTAAEVLQNYNATKGRYTTLGTSSNPAESAAQILASDSTSANGLYWIKPSGYSGSAQLIYCDMSRGGWMLVASNDASDTTIPGGTSRNSLNYALNRNGTNGALGTPDPNKDYIIGNIIDSLSFSSVKVIGWGRGSTNGTYFWDGDQNNLGSSIIAEWNLSSSGSSRRTEVVALANVTLSGSTTLHGNASYFVLDAVACDSGLNANSNQSTVGGAGVLNSSGDPSNGTYLGHGSSEGSYEGWYISGGSHSNSQGYTTWVK